MEPDRLTIFASSESSQKSYTKDGGYFSKAFFDNLDAGLGFNQAFSKIDSKSWPLTQYPIQYGSNVPEVLDRPQSKTNNGVAILLEGKYGQKQDQIDFSIDMARAKTTYEKLGYTVITAKSFDEYKEAFETAKKIGQQNNDDTLIVYYSGHSKIETAPVKEKASFINKDGEIELPPAGVPAKHNPNDTAIVILNKNNGNSNDWSLEPDKSHHVREADITNPIFKAAKEGHFDHVIAVWDSCGAAAIDNEQYRDSGEKQ